MSSEQGGIQFLAIKGFERRRVGTGVICTRRSFGRLDLVSLRFLIREQVFSGVSFHTRDCNEVGHPSRGLGFITCIDIPLRLKIRQARNNRSRVVLREGCISKVICYLPRKLESIVQAIPQNESVISPPDYQPIFFQFLKRIRPRPLEFVETSAKLSRRPKFVDLDFPFRK